MIGRDTIDGKILKLLGEGPAHPSEISRKLWISRTTIHYRLDRLQRVKLARKTTEGRKSVWKPVYKNEHNKSHYRMYKGADMIQAYRQILTLPRRTSLLCVQGSEAAKSEFNHLPASFIKEAHRIFKKKEITMRGLFNEKSLELFDTLNKDMVRSHIGRAQGLKMFSDDKFVASGEMMSAEQFLLLSNPKAKVALVIKDKGVTQIVHDTLKMVFELLDGHKSFDLNNYLYSKTQ